MNDLDFLTFVETTSQLDPASYQYFKCLFQDRTILLNDEIDKNIIESVVLPLKQFETDDINTPVKLILNTNGGSIIDSLMLCNIIDTYKKPLEIIVPAYACSMGTIILCSGNKNPNVTKKCYSFSFGLFHSGFTSIGGETSSVNDVIDFNRSVDNMIKKYVIENTNITEENYDAHYCKQWYLTAPELKELGLIDKIIDKEN